MPILIFNFYITTFEHSVGTIIHLQPSILICKTYDQNTLKLNYVCYAILLRLHMNAGVSQVNHTKCKTVVRNNANSLLKRWTAILSLKSATDMHKQLC